MTQLFEQIFVREPGLDAEVEQLQQKISRVVQTETGQHRFEGGQKENNHDHLHNETKSELEVPSEAVANGSNSSNTEKQLQNNYVEQMVFIGRQTTADVETFPLTSAR